MIKLMQPMEPCRTCAKFDFADSSSWIKIFSPDRFYTEIKNIIFEINIWKLLILENDGLPQKICTDCFAKFCNIFTFRNECDAAQLRLKAIYAKDNTSNPQKKTSIQTPTTPQHPTLASPVTTSSSTITSSELENNFDSNLEFEFHTFGEVNGLYTSESLEENLLTGRESIKSELDKLENSSRTGNTTNTKQILEKCFDNSPETSDSEMKIKDDTINLQEKNKNSQANVRRLISQNPLACKYCISEDVQKLIYQSKDALDAHLKESHDPDKPYNCPDCSNKYRDRCVRRTHIITKHLKKGSICEICGKTCIGHPAKLRRHMERYHSLDNYDCKECGKQFKNCSILRFNYHMRWHNPDQQFKCSHCEKVFIHVQHLKVHEATHTGKSMKINKTECPICQKEFEKVTKLDTHIKQDHKEHTGNVVHPAFKRIAKAAQKNYKGPFRCEHCPRRFHLKRALLKHSVVHSTDGRPFACKECNLTFKRLAHLKMHMDSAHSNNKPFTCQICKKSFALNYVLQDHMKYHGEKSFKCSHCGRGFTHKNILVQHERLHTGEKPFKCDLCSETFAQHPRLLAHMKKKHFLLSLDVVEDLAPSSLDVVTKECLK